MVPSGARRCTPRPSLSLGRDPGRRVERAGAPPAVGKGPVGRVGHLGWERARPPSLDPEAVTALAERLVRARDEVTHGVR